MGFGFRLNLLKSGFPLQRSHWQTASSPSQLSSASVRGREGSFNSARLSFLSIISEEGETSGKDTLKIYSCSSASPQILEDGFSNLEEIRFRRVPKSSSSNTTGNNQMPDGDFRSSKGLEACSAAHFSLLLKNLDALEETFANSDVLKLENEILSQLGRLGALQLFNAYLSRTLTSSSFFDLSDIPTVPIEEYKMDKKVDNDRGKTIVWSGKKEERRSRKRASDNARVSSELLSPKTTWEGFKPPTVSSAKRASNSRRRRLTIVLNEAELSTGVKVIAKLERVKATLEKETGTVATLSCWAEAAGVHKKVLLQKLHFGWYCQDELIRSTRSLVLYLARSYRGLGVAMDDLLQAGNLGLLQGAERYDPSRGYRFSTYVRYWIKKSMSRLVARHARGIQIPFTLSKAINQIQKARKATYNSQMKYPDDDEIAKITGLSLARIKSASTCLRVVGSIDEKMWDSSAGTFMEFTADKSIKSPEETVTRQHMKKDIHDLLKCLNSKERQVLVLRYGLNNYDPKSLEEIGKLFDVSKEWIRKIEKKALTKLRDDETHRSLSHYLNNW
ncbi:hypothetical protein EV1_042891 [Malus domestica]|uniref:RNA polymerase sigma factor sigC isoform X1 n=2 Tax=Malus domestica TaxID=3750 RepID=UPI0039752E9A